MTQISVKRAYDPASTSDGFRIYIDRLWPRGLSHDNFHYNLWCKDISPSTGLREWFHADPLGRWEEFMRRYRAELLANPSLANLRATVAAHPQVTLLYSSHDHLHNNAIVLQRLLSEPQ